jgi:hypothetical protein
LDVFEDASQRGVLTERHAADLVVAIADRPVGEEHGRAVAEMVAVTLDGAHDERRAEPPGER